MREFMARLSPADRVLLIGDTRQHQSVEAGRPFEQLQQAGMHTAKLDQIVRQKDPALKSAIEMFAMGQTAAALDLLHNKADSRNCRPRGAHPHHRAKLCGIADEHVNRLAR